MGTVNTKMKKTDGSYQNHPASNPYTEDLTLQMPDEIILKIFSYLDPTDLEVCDHVSKKWKQIASDSSLIRVPDFAFGKKMWERYIGKIGNNPPLTKEIIEFLEAPCPIFGEGNKVKETHMLVLIPKTVNGKALTLNSVNKLFASYIGEKETYAFYTPQIKDQYGTKQIGKTRWVLMAKRVIPDSLGKSRNEQIEMANEIPDYRAPKLLEATICILTHYVATNERIFHQGPGRSRTCCQEVLDTELANFKTTVGYFSNKGLKVAHSYLELPDESVGVAPLRKVIPK